MDQIIELYHSAVLGTEAAKGYEVRRGSLLKTKTCSAAPIFQMPALSAPGYRTLDNLAHNHIHYQAQHPQYNDGHSDDLIVGLFVCNIFDKTDTGCAGKKFGRNLHSPVDADSNTNAGQNFR